VLTCDVLIVHAVIVIGIAYLIIRRVWNTQPVKPAAFRGGTPTVVLLS
jgi:hypothetical protein